MRCSLRLSGALFYSQISGVRAISLWNKSGKYADQVSLKLQDFPFI